MQTEEEDLDTNDELLELRKEIWIDMTIFDADNKPSLDRGSGLVYDLDEATTMGSYDTNAYAQRREAKSRKNIMGIAAMMADANTKSGAGVSDLEDHLEDDVASAEDDGTKEDVIMKNKLHVEDTRQPNFLLPQVAGIAGSDTAADGSPPTDASAQSPPVEPVAGAKE